MVQLHDSRYYREGRRLALDVKTEHCFAEFHVGLVGTEIMRVTGDYRWRAPWEPRRTILVKCPFLQIHGRMPL